MEVKKQYGIGELAREFDISLRAIRFYEQQGLIKADRSRGRRLFAPEEHEKLRFILFAKNFGLSLSEIEALMLAVPASPDDPITVKVLLEAGERQRKDLQLRQAETENQIRRLSKLMSLLRHADKTAHPMKADQR